MSCMPNLISCLGILSDWRSLNMTFVLCINPLTDVAILTHSHTMTPFDAPGNRPFENNVGKGKIARNEQFLLFPLCFLPV